MAEDIGIDLGTATFLIYTKQRGLILKEPSVIAMNRDTRQVRAVGDDAYRMIGRTPENIVAVRPVRDGVISDKVLTEKISHTPSSSSAPPACWRSSSRV